ncbi:hypothetical protein AC1031_002142 [Aphanomyces cochlioides]|nr:hypothetical protein AC1031_002142 [Aphanomyces cochlioides]
MWASIYRVLNDPSEKDDISPKAKRRRHNKTRSEIGILEWRRKGLEAQLTSMKQSHVNHRSSVSTWKSAATRERLEMTKSVEINKQLQIAISERRDYISRLKRIVHRASRLSVPPDVLPTFEEDSHRIPSDPRERAAAIHRITDKLYKLQQNSFIRAGAFNLMQDVVKGESCLLPGGQCGFCEVWERADSHTFYNRYKTSQNGIPMYSNMVWKVFEEATRIVLVWTTVQRDGQGLCQAIDAQDEMHGWCVFEPHSDDHGKTSLVSVKQTNVSRLVQQLKTPANTDDVIDELKRNCERFDPGQFQGEMPSWLLAFFERSQRWRPSAAHAMKYAEALNGCAI